MNALEKFTQAETQFSNELALVISDIETKTAELNILIETVKKYRPDYVSPISLNSKTSAKTARKTGSPIDEQIMEVLSTNSEKRLTRGELAKVLSTINSASVNTTINRLLKSGKIINGFKVKDLNVPEDSYKTFIKVPAN